MKKLIFLFYIIIIYWLIYLTSGFYSFKISTTQYITNLQKIMLTKPPYNAQGSLIITPDGSGYIPVLFKDKNTLELHKTLSQWNDGNFPQGYYDINKIYIRNKRGAK